MFIKSTVSRESYDCERQLEKLRNGHAKTRIRSCLLWYTKKAVKNKYCFYILSMVSFLVPIILNVILVFSTESLGIQLISFILMGCASFAAYLQQLLDARRKWKIYRFQAEAIKKEVSLFDPEKDSETALLKKIEDGMDLTMAEWMKYFEREA